MLYEPSSLALQENLDLIPRDRHVRLFKLKDKPEWYATWSIRAKPVTLCLGVDEHGLIAEFAKQWTVTPSPSQACLQHSLVRLWCRECINGARSRMKRSA